MFSFEECFVLYSLHPKSLAYAQRLCSMNSGGFLLQYNLYVSSPQASPPKSSKPPEPQHSPAPLSAKMPKTIPHSSLSTNPPSDSISSPHFIHYPCTFLTSQRICKTFVSPPCTNSAQSKKSSCLRSASQTVSPRTAVFSSIASNPHPPSNPPHPPTLMSALHTRMKAACKFRLIFSWCDAL